jgi:hypothetical protein
MVPLNMWTKVWRKLVEAVIVLRVQREISLRSIALIDSMLCDAALCKLLIHAGHLGFSKLKFGLQAENFLGTGRSGFITGSTWRAGCRSSAWIEGFGGRSDRNRNACRSDIFGSSSIRSTRIFVGPQSIVLLVDQNLLLAELGKEHVDWVGLPSGGGCIVVHLHLLCRSAVVLLDDIVGQRA